MAKNEVRIIGGKWRGRKLKFPDAKGLRPSQDRARETLFNWLAPWIADARVLDLFAGSGALGFEALSRGAASAELVELSKQAAAALESNKTQLAASSASIYRRDAFKHLQNSSATYNLVFIDPPFDQALVQKALNTLHAQQKVAEDGLIYVEQPKREPLPDGYTVFKDKAFGDSRALLLQPYSQSE